jgi:integrase
VESTKTNADFGRARQSAANAHGANSKQTRLREAQREANSQDFKKSKTFAQLAEAYTTAKCPNKRLEERDATYCENEAYKLKHLIQYFGRMDVETIRLHQLHGYKQWRVKQVTRKSPRITGTRTVDIELATLSNVLNYAVNTGQLDFNYIRAGRPRFTKDSEVRHCRETAPQSGDEIHRIASYFFENPRSETLGWLTFFQSMSGCRMSELLRLRTDAKTPEQPGYIEGNHLFLGRRSKHGVNPWVLITPEFRDMLDHFFAWHKLRFSKTPWYFGGMDRVEVIAPQSLIHGLYRAVKELKLGHRTSHGFRSFYVTKRRSDGVSDVEIAAEIGDQDVSQISRTYGARPPNWEGQKPLSFLPATGEPAWRRPFKALKQGKPSPLGK